MSQNHTFDSIIIGSGQAGNPLASTLASQGEKVALIEKDQLGGTCVNTGCTPTKMYVASARRMWEIQNASKLGVEITGAPKIDLKAVKKRKDDLVGDSRKGIKKSFQENEKISIIRGKAEFVDSKRIKVGSKIFTANKFFINVGARPVIPEGFESVDYLTNESILELETVPKELVILGGGYIALEFAQMFSRFGSKVTILELQDHLIGKEDSDISALVQEILEEEGIQIYCRAKESKAERLKSGEIRVSFNQDGKKQHLKASHILLAVGRQPNSDLIKAEKAGLEIDDRGYIKVNPQLETNVKGIYALGDCNGQGAFTHTSFNDFEIMKNQLYGDQSKSLDDRVTNYCLYIDPPLARVGMYKKQAEKLKTKVLYAEMEMSDISRAKEKGETKGKMEVLVDAQSGRILGAVVFGTGADEIIGTFITAIYGKIHYETLINSVQTHPTVTELIPTLLKNLKPLNK